MTPQITCLGKTSPVLRVFTYTCVMGFLKDIGRKTFMCQTKPRHVTPQINHLRKNKHCSEGFQHTFIGISMEIGVKTFIFRGNLDM